MIMRLCKIRTRILKSWANRRSETFAMLSQAGQMLGDLLKCCSWPKLVLEECWKVIGKVTFRIRIKHNRNKVSVQKRIPLSSVTKAWDSVKLVSLHNAIASDVDSLHNLAWRTEFKWDIVFRFTYHPKFSLLFLRKRSRFIYERGGD